MARGPRDDAPGSVHHVMVRGIERRSIFRDDADRGDLLRRLSQLAPELGFRCYAWALMPNHFHLVVGSSRTPISRLMARLGTGYARRFNERHDRVGHLFQNRFRSRRAIDDSDLIGLVLYVTRNPTEAGLSESGAALELFPWCGLGALLGRRPPLPFEAVPETLALFDAEPARARQRVRDRLEAPSSGALALESQAQPQVVQANALRFDELLREVCSTHALAQEDLCSRRRTSRIAAARTELATRAVATLGLSGSQVARRLGLTSAAVSLMLARTRRHSNKLTF